MGEGARGKGFSKQHSSSNSRFGEIITTKPPIMTKKRKNTDLQAEDILYNKRSRLSQADGSDDSPSAAQSKIDPIYGQRGAFPGLDDSRGEDDLFYGPASDGLEYLRMVRFEAKSVPKLLVAPASSAAPTQDEDLYADLPQGYYADGAYTATPLLPSYSHYAHPGQGEAEDFDPQEAYYASLCARFDDISKVLQTPPPPMDTDSTNPPLDYWNTRKWRNKMLHTTPTMTLLSQLPQEMVIHGLVNLESTLTSNNFRTGKGKNVGVWAWGLLARCREVGQMGSEEVGVLRDLGKRAVWLLRRIAAGEAVGAGPEEVEYGFQGEDGGDEEDTQGDGGEDIGGGEDANGLEVVAGQNEEEEKLLAEARARILLSLPPSSQAQDDQGISSPSKSGGKKPQTKLETPSQPEIDLEADKQDSPAGSAFDQMAMHATLDMLVTIIGECYGQRDLLDGRLLWDEIDGFQ